MTNFINKIYKNNTKLYRVILFLITSVSIVYLFPKAGQFKYDFTNGQLWKYDNLYAPFDFAIQKTEAEITVEKQAVKATKRLYFKADTTVMPAVIKTFKTKLQALQLKDSFTDVQKKVLQTKGLALINTIYTTGFLKQTTDQFKTLNNDFVTVLTNNRAKTVVYKNLYTAKKVLKAIANISITDVATSAQLASLLSSTIKPNIVFDADFTQKALDAKLKTISLTKGKVASGALIILKGAIVEGNKLAILQSLKSESESKTRTQQNQYWIVFGYTILVALALLMLLLFLRKNRHEIYENNTKITFIFFNVFLMILIQTLVVKYNSYYLYVVPLSILPIVLKAFFDARLGLFTHVLTVLLLGFIVPDSFEFIYLHIIAGIVTILSVSELYKRANLFISVAQITGIYMLTYFAFSILKTGDISQINTDYFVLFAVNGLLSFLAIILIYIYEKLFGLVSDISLLELSDTNSKLLRALNEKAPGTFQHSMQVANLAEAAANEIGANAMLVRTGALYHDIGKMENPTYFTENQTTGVNPHNELAPKDSAKIIIDHVIKGVEIAKKYNIPDRVIDFIRTHHGTSTTYYFYQKEKALDANAIVNIDDFKYLGPAPFSRETAILMMCDAAEASSKSIKKPTAQSINNLIDKIIDKQIAENQFLNANITFKEIETIKKVIKKKLLNIYHLRIEYPE